MALKTKVTMMTSRVLASAMSMFVGLAMCAAGCTEEDEGDSQSADAAGMIVNGAGDSGAGGTTGGGTLSGLDSSASPGGNAAGAEAGAAPGIDASLDASTPRDRDAGTPSDASHEGGSSDGAAQS